jgi:SAM-dependent methyltransferase
MPASHLTFEPVRDIFAAMQFERINGVPLSDVIGGGDPEYVASEILAAMENYVDITSQRSILDVGCGCGRIATALTQYLGPASHYVGVDIVSELVEFGKKSITPRYPNFKFLLLEEGNLSYDWWRQKRSQKDIATLSEALPPGTVDLAISVSLFTHLDSPAAADILAAIACLLKSGGQAFVTVFVLDSSAREGIESGRTGFSFKHRTPSGQLLTEKLEEPTHAVAYEMGHLEDLIHSVGLRLERWVPGYWSQGNAGETFQDVLILRKA